MRYTGIGYSDGIAHGLNKLNIFYSDYKRFGFSIVNSATFFSPIDARSSSSVQVSAAKLSKLDFSSLAAMVIRMDFKVFAEPV